MRRVDPPEGLADRVLARAASEHVGRRGSRWRWPLAAAATVLAAVVGLQFYQQREMRIQGERAKEEVMLALRIAGTEVHSAQQKVLRLGAAGEDER